MRVARAFHVNAERRFGHLINTWRPSQSSALLPVSLDRAMHENNSEGDPHGGNIVSNVAEGIRDSSDRSMPIARP